MDGKIDLIFKIGTYFFLSSEHPGNEKKKDFISIFRYVLFKSVRGSPFVTLFVRCPKNVIQ